MDFLKDKKNLPIVIGIAVAVLVAAGGLIAFELGLFGGGAPTPVPTQLAHRGGPTPGGPGGPDSAPTPMAPPGPPAGAPPPAMMARMMASHGMTAPAANMAAAPAPAVVVDPTRGPDPFFIPGGTKRVASAGSVIGGGLKGMKTPLREILPPFNLFKVQAPEPPPSPPLPVVGPTPGSAPPANIRFDGVVSAADGIYAILEVNGQSQTVKPGDSLQDGSRVTSIQATSVTLRSATGVTSTIQMTGGAGQTDPNGNGGDPNGNGGDPNGGGQFGQQ